MTPMMEQYFEIKNQYKDYLLFYRLGDFYEMFFDDALTASRELELTLTGRDCGEKERAPMCGVPFHSAEGYIARLIEKGYKVAICEQLEDPALAKTLVKRDVIRIITPGTVLEPEMLTESKNNYLCSICLGEERCGVCFADISTSQVYATSFSGGTYQAELLNELGTYSPREVILNVPASFNTELTGFITGRLNAMLEDDRARYFEPARASEIVEKQFSGILRDSDREKKELMYALGALIQYINETQKTDTSYIKDLNIYENGQYMQLDIATRRNLELTETLRTKEKKGTLLWVLDKTRSSPGARLLRQWIEHPLLNVTRITRRQSAVGELVDNYMLREDVSDLLSGVLDLERLVTKIVYGNANARDLRAVAATLALIPPIKEQLAVCTGQELVSLREGLDTLEDICSLIDKAIVKDPPFSVREGGMICDGFNEDIDKLRNIVTNGKDWIANTEAKEKEATGIKNLRIGYNRVFGYYIEVTKSYMDLVPDTYIRKQTLANAERYITQELKDTEAMVLGAGDRLASLEYELFTQVRSSVAAAAARLQGVAANLARLDVYCSLASVAAKYNYVCPSLNEDKKIYIRDGRHPVVERFVKDAYFVPNDTTLDMKNNRVMIITGPNMAGKSTYMRQVALITVMTQIGSFVPAASADMCVVDRVFTRVGASDDLASGQSTFMLEMNEVATILRSATKNSLIIYDEVGRGTSTFDGMSIARAILEYTQSKKVGAKTLFATHYHELTGIADELDGVVNYNIAARKRGDGIIFLRKIVPGSTDDSYGIEVAKLAGIPNEVIKRAREVLAEVEAKSRAVTASDVIVTDDDTISLDDCINGQVIDDIRAADLNNMSPFEALSLLNDLQQRLK
ncbi:MAG: DNA mismatch repair protein MutS [Clostridia bacterium]|nr:DNA mismatch repair protein MutS [Clostridia bacterium]